MPPKVQTFLWRACHEIIPSRHIGTNPFCGFCKVEIETGAHLFFECPFFSDIWAEPPFSLSQKIPSPNFSTGLCGLRELVPEDNFALACVVIWNIWNYRNGVLHESVSGKGRL